MDQQELRNTFNEARATLRVADMCAAIAVEFAAGRLRRLDLDTSTLRELKRELVKFNAKKGKWTG